MTDDSKTTITLSLSIDQTNLILEALGSLPFAKVFELIGSIQGQAKRQLEGPPAVAPAPTPTVVEAASGE